MDFLTNDWFAWVFQHYSIAIGGLPFVLIALVKLLAIFDPKIPSNSLIAWIQGTFYKTTGINSKNDSPAQ